MTDIPAFPFDELNQQTGCVAVQHAGMTLRDYFAAKAMQALIPPNTLLVGSEMAEQAYRYADEMLKARDAK